MFSNYLLVLLSALLFLLGVGCLLWSILRTSHPDHGSIGPDDESDDEGGLAWDIDAPLDLPPGIYTIPPEPVGVGR